MSKKIDFGKTKLEDLYLVFKFSNHEEFQLRKARLLPCADTMKEVATTSIFLASLSAVKEYREELLSEIGVNKIKNKNVELHVYTELSDDKKEKRPDGLIVVTSGKNSPIIEWAGFVESKVKNNTLDDTQISKYVEFSREVGINSIITISNYLVPNPTQSPVKIKQRNFNLYHWSWTYLKVTATKLIRTNMVEDEDHIYILSELRRYFDSHKNLWNYKKMGDNWSDSVKKIHTYSPEQRIGDKLLKNIVESFSQEEKDISLQLTDTSTFYIEVMAKENRIEEIEEMLQNKKVVTTHFIIDKNKENTFSIDVDFIRRMIRCYTKIEIQKGKSTAQTTALVNLFEDVSGYTDQILVDAFYLRNKSKKNAIPLSKLIEEKKLKSPYSVLEKEYGDEVKCFEIFTQDSISTDFFSVGKFVNKIESIAERFLNQVVINKMK